MSQNDRFYPTIEDDQFMGPDFFEATVQPRWYSDTRGSLKKGDRLIVQKTNIPKLMVIRGILREGKFRSTNPPYDPDRIWLISVVELMGLQPRVKMAKFEGIDKFIRTGDEVTNE
jgi:hypothetical protein